jgi:hypothetical protein
MFKIQKQTFLRLYRYYLKKLFLTWLLFNVVLIFFLLLSTQGKMPWGNFSPLTHKENYGWKSLWLYSLMRNGFLIYLSAFLISLLVQKTKTEDAWVLTTLSPVNRQSILAAKLASFYTYYFISCLFFTNLATFSNPLFVLFDWFLLVLVNFLLFIIPLFYLFFPAQSKIKKFLILVLYGIFLFVYFYLALTLKFQISSNRRNFWNPWLPLLLSIFIGPLFLWLYWDNFRRHDY